jgi:Arc/MetJ-type ribon-helix-helix transcriptional regulator
MEKIRLPITVRIDMGSLNAMDRLIVAGYFLNRTEFIRAAIREKLDRHPEINISKK